MLRADYQDVNPRMAGDHDFAVKINDLRQDVYNYVNVKLANSCRSIPMFHVK